MELLKRTHELDKLTKSYLSTKSATANRIKTILIDFNLNNSDITSQLNCIANNNFIRQFVDCL